MKIEPQLIFKISSSLRVQVLSCTTVGLMLAMTGCNSMSMQKSDQMTGGITSTFELNSYVLGFVPAPRLKNSELCPHGQVERLDMKMSGMDVLLSAVTIGIYVPHRVDITCSNLN